MLGGPNYARRAQLERQHRAETRTARAPRPTMGLGWRVDWDDPSRPGRHFTGTIVRATDGSAAVVWDDGRCTSFPDGATTRPAEV